jgi:hypothetical protein
MPASGDRARACSSSKVFSRVRNFNILNNRPDPPETANLFFFPRFQYRVVAGFITNDNNNNILAGIARFVLRYYEILLYMDHRACAFE